MRINIEIDDDLMDEALNVSGFKTKKETIEEGLKLLIQQKKQDSIKSLRGKLRWEGNIDEMRADR